jgi:hypothetical protein
MNNTILIEMDPVDVALLLGLCWHARKLGFVEPEDMARLDAVERKLEDAENTVGGSV